MLTLLDKLNQTTELIGTIERTDSLNLTSVVQAIDQALNQSSTLYRVSPTENDSWAWRYLYIVTAALLTVIALQALWICRLIYERRRKTRIVSLNMLPSTE
jgi:hypothetical protein